jgi:Lar family restriction alleviation protein
MAELLPCPFCGGAPKEPDTDQIEYNGYIGTIDCSQCDAHVETQWTEKSEAEAIERIIEVWNRRATPTESAQREG